MVADASAVARQRMFERLNLRSAIGLLSLAALGVAGNHFNVSLFFGVNFLLGGIATMLAIRLYSAGWGILVGFVAATYTFVLWGHPYAVAIFTLEAAFVAFVLRRTDVENLVLWDGVYWVALGLPAVWLAYDEIMQMGSTASQLVMTKQAVNGVFNALIASILASHLPVRRLLKGEPKTRRVSFRLLLIHCLLIAAMIPTAVTMALRGRNELLAIQHSVIERLDDELSDAVNHARVIHSYNVDLLRAAGRSVLGMRDTEDTRQAVWFEELLSSLMGVLRVEFIAADSRLSAVWTGQEGITFGRDDDPWSLHDGGPSVTIGGLSWDSRIHVEERIGEPHLGLTIPIVDGNKASGSVYVALAPEYFRELFSGISHQEHFATLIDQDGMVIATTDPGQRPMQAWSLNDDVRQLGSGVYQRLSRKEQVPEMVRWRSSRYEIRKHVSQEFPWDLVISVPAIGPVDKLRAAAIGNLWIALVVSFLAVFAAPLIARRVSAPLVVLTQSTKVLPDRIGRDGHSVGTLKSGIREIAELLDNFRQMALEIGKTLARMDEVAKDLAEKEAQLRIALDNMPGGMFMIDNEFRFQVFNDRVKEIFDIPDAALQTGGSLRDGIRVRAERGDYGAGDIDELVERRLEGYTDKKTLRDEERLPNGRVIELVRRPTDDGGTVVVVTDITERKKAEEELAEKEAQLREIIENMTEGLVCYDADQRLILCNDTYRDFYGYTEEDVAPGTHFEDLVRLDEKRGAVVDDGTYTQERIAHRAQPHGAHVIQLKDGRWLQMREQTTASGTVSIQTDITERKRVEEQLLAQKQRAEEANKLVTEKNQMLESLSNQLAKYLSPQVYQSIFSGKQEVKVTSRRKKLTVFFSDIVGFTETTDNLEAEELSNLLNHYLTEMSRIALEYGATIDKYIGDAMLLFFGDPETKGAKEDAKSCVMMAIAMQRRMRELEQEWRDRGLEQPFRIRVGIATGFCTVGNFGSQDRMDYTIIGNEVNLAARLESSAEPGGILIAHETFSLVKEGVMAEEQPPLTVKGFDKPIHYYKVAGILDDLIEEGMVIREEQDGVKVLVDLTKRDKSSAIRTIRKVLSQLED